ncbi:unnamed protein product, partial [Ectocarpus sp. 12 AP-2014]
MHRARESLMFFHQRSVCGPCAVDIFPLDEEHATPDQRCRRGHERTTIVEIYVSYRSEKSGSSLKNDEDTCGRGFYRARDVSVDDDAMGTQNMFCQNFCTSRQQQIQVARAPSRYGTVYGILHRCSTVTSITYVLQVYHCLAIGRSDQPFTGCRLLHLVILRPPPERP